MDLPATVCAAGGLGSIATSLRTADQFRQDLARLRELTEEALRAARDRAGGSRRGTGAARPSTVTCLSSAISPTRTGPKLRF
jgi:NAD(P)H-dependent flavin oxidoreductase YrpB (nitropropane dioxygenase family)